MTQVSEPQGTASVVATVTVDGHVGPVDLHLSGGAISAIVPAADPAGGFGGAYAFAGFVDTHVHLDKAHLLDRLPPSTGAEGGLAAAMAAVRAAKRQFTVEDVRSRAARVLERAIIHGTTLMRSYVEVDPDAGLRSWEALLGLRETYSQLIDLRLCAFAQDGTTGSPRTAPLLRAALRSGADAVGGCPYADSDPAAHVALILDLAEEFGVPADFHIDLDLDASWEHTSLVIDAVEARGLHGRVSIGHATKLSAMEPPTREALARRLAGAGIGLVVLPATDLFLPGRDVAVLQPRAVAPPLALAVPDLRMAVATNNVVNPFTPYGDADLLRMANLYATVSQLSTDDEVSAIWQMVTSSAGAILGAGRALTVGAPADVVVLDAPDPATALRELRQPLAGWRSGAPTFTWPRPALHRPPVAPQPVD